MHFCLLHVLQVSRYIVAQQMRMRGAASSDAASDAVSETAPQPLQDGAQASGISLVVGAGTDPSDPPPSSSDEAAAATAAAVAAAASAAASRLASCRSFHGAPHLGILGCQHYQRKCQLVAPCCNKVAGGQGRREKGVQGRSKAGDLLNRYSPDSSS